jgi:hypothetical protein
MKFIKYLIIVNLLLSVAYLKAQDDLEALLDAETENTIDYAIATFLSTRIINGHSAEKMPAGGLDLRIAHRFGQVDDGLKKSFGLDETNSYISLEYGINEWLMAGLGRATYYEDVNGFLKVLLLRQCKGTRRMPVTLMLHAAMVVNTTTYGNTEKNDDLVSRFDYSYQVLIARKLNPRLSLQLSPTLVHRNLVLSREENNSLFALGIGGRYKIAKRISVNAEYFIVTGNKNLDRYSFYDPIAIGVDIQAGGHVFQLHFTNARPMTENSFIGETSANWWDGDIRFGFNISQVFTLK